ncbi:hypothetical protein FRB95_013948 [Tulasnella sp. JGI-2019a]|nr:hypothetical protein FRB95_013948 [Tulasnella sp. JGI-2019a]
MLASTLFALLFTVVSVSATPAPTTQQGMICVTDHTARGACRTSLSLPVPEMQTTENFKAMFSYVYLGGSSVMTVNPNTVPGAVNKGTEHYVFYDLTHQYFGITGDLQEYQKFGNASYPATFSLC